MATIFWIEKFVPTGTKTLEIRRTQIVVDEDNRDYERPFSD